MGPAFPMLLQAGGPHNTTLVPSAYAKAAKAAGLDMIAWTFERSGPLANVRANADFYYASYPNISGIINYDGQLYEVLHALVQKVGIKGMFSDWSSTVSYYANCFDVKGPRAGKYH